jgi:hypothetical protein
MRRLLHQRSTNNSQQEALLTKSSNKNYDTSGMVATHKTLGRPMVLASEVARMSVSDMWDYTSKGMSACFEPIDHFGFPGCRFAHPGYTCS